MSSDMDWQVLLRALPDPVIVVSGTNTILFVNSRGEEFLDMAARSLVGQPLQMLISRDSPITDLVKQARKSAGTVAEYGLTLNTPRLGIANIGVVANAVAKPKGSVIMTFRERSLADVMALQERRYKASRSVSAMGAMLSHEIKNPLLGIRGAAQLLGGTVGEEDRALTKLIQEECDRISNLLSQVDAFTDERPPAREAVNIHAVLDHAHNAAQAGFARHVDFVMEYDPSLPPVYANRGQLIQVFLNLIKNAAEAVPEQGGQIRLGTSYRHGVRLSGPGGREKQRFHLPLMVEVSDNGPGIPPDVQTHLFNPFVTSKPEGKGLGLALAAKIIGEHGGMIDFETEACQTVFRVSLPIAKG